MCAYIYIWIYVCMYIYIYTYIYICINSCTDIGKISSTKTIYCLIIHDHCLTHHPPTISLSSAKISLICHWLCYSPPTTIKVFELGLVKFLYFIDGQICAICISSDLRPDRQTPEKTSVCALTTSRQNKEESPWARIGAALRPARRSPKYRKKSLSSDWRQLGKSIPGHNRQPGIGMRRGRE